MGSMRPSIWSKAPASQPAERSVWRRNPFKDTTETPLLVRSYRAYSKHLAQAAAGQVALRAGVTGERLDVAKMLKDRAAQGDPDIPPDVRAEVQQMFSVEPGSTPAPAARRDARPPPDIQAEIDEAFEPEAAPRRVQQTRAARTVPGMAAPAKPARSARLAAAEEQQRRGIERDVRGMSEEDFYAATGTAPKITAAERAAWAERAQQRSVRDSLEIVSSRAARREAPEAPAPEAPAPEAPRRKLRRMTGEEEAPPPPPRTRREERARDRLQRTRDLPDEVETEVQATVVRPSKRIGMRSETTGKTYVRAMDLAADAPVFVLGSIPALPTMKKGGHGKTRGPLVESGQVRLEPGWIRGIGCGDARYDKAGIAVLVNGAFSGHWAASWEGAEELGRRLLAVVAKNNPRRKWAPLSKTKRRKAPTAPGWITRRGAR